MPWPDAAPLFLSPSLPRSPIQLRPLQRIRPRSAPGPASGPATGALTQYVAEFELATSQAGAFEAGYRGIGDM